MCNNIDQQQPRVNCDPHPRMATETESGLGRLCAKHATICRT